MCVKYIPSTSVQLGALPSRRQKCRVFIASRLSLMQETVIIAFVLSLLPSSLPPPPLSLLLLLSLSPPSLSFFRTFFVIKVGKYLLTMAQSICTLSKGYMYPLTQLSVCTWVDGYCAKQKWLNYIKLQQDRSFELRHQGRVDPFWKKNKIT